MHLFYIFYIIIIIFITIIFAFYYHNYHNYKNEYFTVPIPDYENPELKFGYCGPNLSLSKFKKGKFNTKCWKNMTIEMCESMNNHGFYCGVNPKNGKKLKCVHKLGECTNDPICFSSCYEQRDYPSYMIEVNSNNLIGLAP